MLEILLWLRGRYCQYSDMPAGRATDFST